MDYRQSYIAFCFFSCFVLFVASIQESSTSQEPLHGQHACAAQSDTSCSDCLNANTGCYWCEGTRRCGYYPYKQIIPNTEQCAQFSEVYWGTCKISLEATVILCGIGLGILLILTTCCCCWCCKATQRRKIVRQMRRMERNAQEMRANEERTAQRKAQGEARRANIKAKYGLGKEVSSYSRMGP